jgi:hypothetical protein
MLHQRISTIVGFRLVRQHRRAALSVVLLYPRSLAFGTSVIVGQFRRRWRGCVPGTLNIAQDVAQQPDNSQTERVVWCLKVRV